MLNLDDDDDDDDYYEYYYYYDNYYYDYYYYYLLYCKVIKNNFESVSQRKRNAQQFHAEKLNK